MVSEPPNKARSVERKNEVKANAGRERSRRVYLKLVVINPNLIYLSIRILSEKNVRSSERERRRLFARSERSSARERWRPFSDG